MLFYAFCQPPRTPQHDTGNDGCVVAQMQLLFQLMYNGKLECATRVPVTPSTIRTITGMGLLNPNTRLLLRTWVWFLTGCLVSTSCSGVGGVAVN